MTTHDFIIENQTFPATRQDINLALQALASCSISSIEPTITYPGQIWIDASTSLIKQRNNTNSAWVTQARAGQPWWGLSPSDIGSPTISAMNTAIEAAVKNRIGVVLRRSTSFPINQLNTNTPVPMSDSTVIRNGSFINGEWLCGQAGFYEIEATGIVQTTGGTPPGSISAGFFINVNGGSGGQLSYASANGNVIQIPGKGYLFIQSGTTIGLRVISNAVGGSGWGLIVSEPWLKCERLD